MTKSLFDDGAHRNQPSLQMAKADLSAAPAMAVLELVLDNGRSQSDKITNDGLVKVSGMEEGASWQWSADKGANWSKTSQEHEGVVTLSGDGAKSLMVRVINKNGQSASSELDFTLDTQLDEMWYDHGRDSNAGLYLLSGVAEKNAQVTLRDFNTGQVIQTTRSSAESGKWSASITPEITVSGLTRTDGSASTANGVYTVLSVNRVAELAHRFGDAFSSTGKPVVDISKTVFHMGAGEDAWFIWATLGGGYVISHLSGADEWYRERTVNPKIASPDLVEAWDAITGPAAGLAAQAGQEARLVHLDQVIFDHGGFPVVGYRSVTLEQTDLAGNVSERTPIYTYIQESMPVMLDLDSKDPYASALVFRDIPLTNLTRGVAFAPDVGWTQSAEGHRIDEIRISFMARQTLAGYRLVLDSEWDMMKDVPDSRLNIAGLPEGVSYRYEPCTLRFYKTGAGHESEGFTLQEAKSLVEYVKLRNTLPSANDLVIDVTLEGDFPPESSRVELRIDRGDIPSPEDDRTDSIPDLSAPPAASASSVKLALASDTGTDGDDKITNDGRVTVSGIAAGSTWQWSADKGATWSSANASSGGTVELTGDGEKMLMVKVSGPSGQETTGSISFTLDTFADEALTDYRLQDTGAPILTGTADKGATVTLYDYGSHQALYSTTASKDDGSWRFQLQASGSISGLTKWDGSASSANGVYTLLSSTEAQALSHSFSSEFSATGKPVLDISKAAYSMQTATDIWYLWSALGGDYIISRTAGADEWYQAGPPKYAHFAGTPTLRYWQASNLTATQLAAEQPLEDGSRSHLVSVAEGATGYFDQVGWYRLDQVDLAGNRSELGFTNANLDTTRRFIDIDSATPDIQSGIVTHASTADMLAGLSLLPDAARAGVRNADARGIRLQFSGAGLDTQHDRLVLDRALTLNASIDDWQNWSIPGMKALRYRFDAVEKELAVEWLDRSEQWFNGSQVEKILDAIKLTNAHSQAGERVMTMHYRGMADGPLSWSSTLAVSSEGLALRLPASVGAHPDSATRYFTEPGLLSKGVSLQQEFLRPTAAPIRAMEVTIAAAGWEAAEDKLTVDLNEKLPSNQFGKPDRTLNDLRYAYNAAERKLTIDSASGQALSPDAIQVLLKSVGIVNPLGLDGERELQFRLVSFDGERGAPVQSRLVLDSQAPLLDLDYFTPGVQATAQTSVGLALAGSGAGLFQKSITAPAANDIAQIQLVFSGSGDLLVKEGILIGDPANGAISLIEDSSAANRTIGGLEGIGYTYSAASKTLSLQKTSGSAMSGLEVKTILEALKWTSTSTSPDSRNIAITLTDEAGNRSSAQLAIQLDTTPAPSIQAELTSEPLKSYQMLALGDILGATNKHNLSKGESAELPLPTGMDAKAFLAAIKGVSVEWGGRGISGNANTTLSEYKSYQSLEQALSSGKSFMMAHQGGSYVKGDLFNFAVSQDGKKLTLTNQGGFYSDNTDLYQFGGSNQTSNGNYDIGNIRILYQADNGRGNTVPAIKVRFDGTQAKVGDVISLHELYSGGLLASKRLTAADVGAADASVSMAVSTLQGLPGQDDLYYPRSLYAKYSEVSGNTSKSDDLFNPYSRPEDTVQLRELKVASPNGNDGHAYALNTSGTHYASISDAGTPSTPGNYTRGLLFNGKVGAAGSSDEYLITVSMGSKVLAFDTVKAGDFSLASAASLLAPGYYDDLSISATNISSGHGNGLNTTVQGLKLGSFWAAQSLGDTRGGHGNDNFLLGATKNGLNTLIQTNGGDDTLTLGAFGKQGNFAATITDFTAGADKIAVFGKSIDLGNLSQFVKEVAPIQGGAGTKLVVDLDGAAAGNQTYTLHLQNVAYQPANTHTLFGV